MKQFWTIFENCIKIYDESRDLKDFQIKTIMRIYFLMILILGIILIIFNFIIFKIIGI